MRFRNLLPTFRKRTIPFLLTGAMICSLFVNVDLQAEQAYGSDTNTVLDSFENPDKTDKPMVRWWFPDSYSGEDDQDMIDEYITSLSEAGYGGVEVTVMMSGTNINNDELKDYGWGTENYKKMLKKILKAANKIDGGFIVDITITAHWPTVINNIDPNDDSASQEIIAGSVQKVTSTSGNIEITLPETKTTDSTDALDAAPFIFVDTLEDAYIAKVAKVNDDGSYVYDLDSIMNVTDAVDSEYLHAAGVPDEEAFDSGDYDFEGLTYQDVLDIYGSAPDDNADLSSSYNGKMDADGNRARMQDTQYRYTVNLDEVDFVDGTVSGNDTETSTTTVKSTKTTSSTSEEDTNSTGSDVSGNDTKTTVSGNDADTTTVSGNDTKTSTTTVKSTKTTSSTSEDISSNDLSSDVSGNDIDSSNDDTIAAGDYVLLSDFVRGTGQVMSDGPFGGASDAMYSRTYVTNYFSEDGVKAIIAYWDKNILDDELIGLLKENGSSIFEDSIEASTKSGGSFWSNSIKDEIKDEKGENYNYTDLVSLIVTQSSSSFTSENISDDQIADIEEDYDMALGNLYESAHSEKISDWAATFGYSYRAQCYSISGEDICGAAEAVDIPEGDNSSKGDGLRKMASVVNVEDKDYFSMEAVTATGNSKMNWADVVTEVAQNFSDGINHVVLHGCPYNKSVTGWYSDWPGWTAFGNNFADSYAPWRSDWEDMDSLTSYIARNQAILKNGTAKVEVAFLNDTTTGSDLSDGNAFQELLDAGYSYNEFTEALMESDNAVVTNHVLAEAGPAYQVLVMNQVSTISAEGMQKVLEYAEAGLPIILYNTDVDDIYGSDTDANNTDTVVEEFKKLESMGNVKIATTTEEVLEKVEEFGITPAASYDASKLETSHYVDETNGSDYYYMYNNVVPSNTGMDWTKYLEYQEGDVIDTTVTISGEGTPYKLDAWTGEVEELTEYTDNGDGTYSFEVKLDGGESAIYAVLNDKEHHTSDIHANQTDSVEVDKDGDTWIAKSNTPGTYDVTLSDGTALEATVDDALDNLELKNGWTATINSYGPSEELEDESNINTEKTEIAKAKAEEDTDWEGVTIYNNPSLTDITTLDFDIDTLGYIGDIEATEDELNTLGVSSMEYVSGTVEYSNIFDLPEGWTNTTGATLEFTSGVDEVVKVTVNGITIDGINVVSQSLDIGDYLTTGKNTITIKLDTPLFNRMRGEERDAIVSASGMNMTGTSTIDTGLTSVTLVPYTNVVLTSGTSDNNSPTPVKPSDNSGSSIENSGSSNTNHSTNYVGGVQSTIGGHYDTNNAITGVACETPKSTFYSDLGAQTGSNVNIDCIESECGAAAKKCVNDEITALTNAGIQAKLVDMIDIYAYVDGTSVLNASSPIRFTLSIDDMLQNDNEDFEIILVQEGGNVTLLQDIDEDPSTVTFDTPGFGVFALAEVPAGSLNE